VILGLLRMLGERTGYDIKAAIDDSTEFFWPASYGRIYPELQRLEREGLVEGRDEPRGGRPRKLYALTPAGEQALDEWLTSRAELSFDLRDEGLLKFFLADAVPHDQMIANLRAMRARHERIAARLRELEPFVQETEPLRFPILTLRRGIDIHAAAANWCTEMEKQLGETDPAA
jgi:PadR family transcriptional regulator, regulatory protein AphA